MFVRSWSLATCKESLILDAFVDLGSVRLRDRRIKLRRGWLLHVELDLAESVRIAEPSSVSLSLIHQ